MSPKSDPIRRRRRPPWATGRTVLAAIFATVLVQMVVMALISEYDAHPDERFHVTTADYYLHWWLPPAAGDPRVISSLSGYGFSYHYNLTPAYFLAGRAVAPLQHLIQHPYLAFRLFNVGLFAVLIVVALRRRDRLFGLLLLLAPAQLWYVFCYFNDDALAFFLCLLAGWQLMGPETAFSRFLSRDDWTSGRLAALLFALILALILLCKQNYHVFLAFLGFYALWTVAFAGAPRRAGRLALKWAAVALAAICCAWPRYALDDWLNDPDRPGNQGLTKRQRIREVSESYAPTGFRPSQSGTEAASPYLRMKTRDVSFWEVFEYRWLETSFQSFVGAYGYMDIYSGRLFYLVSFIVHAGLAATLAARVLRHGTPADRLFGLACVLFCVGLVFASAYNSWAHDYQPQGRYLFPGLAILFVGVLHLRRLIPERVLWQYGVLIWSISCYSFLVTGLRWIPKA